MSNLEIEDRREDATKLATGICKKFMLNKKYYRPLESKPSAKKVVVAWIVGQLIYKDRSVWVEMVESYISIFKQNKENIKKHKAARDVLRVADKKMKDRQSTAYH